MAEQKSTSSQLISRLKEISRGTASPLGFGRVQARNVPAMLLVASLRRNDSVLAEAALAAGADALEVHLHGSLSEFTKRQVAKEEEKAIETTQGEETAEVPEERPSGKADGGARQESPPEGESAPEDERDQVKFGSLDEERASIQEVLRAATGKPVGVVVGSDGELTLDELGEMAQMGVDFVVVHPHRAPVGLLGVETLGHVARLDRSYPAGPLRGLNELDLDAMEVVIGRPESSLPTLTIHDLANIRQAIEPIRRPVLLLAARVIHPGDLKYLREMGLEALVLGPDLLGDTPDEVKAKVSDYRQTIDKLGPPIGRGRGAEGRRVILPRIKPPAEEEEVEEDE